MSRLPSIISKLLHTSKMPAAFILYGSRGSTCTDRVRYTLAEGGFNNYELKYLNLQAGEQKSKEHTALNPWGKVPILTTLSGFTLYESRAICKYLAAMYSFPLLPPPSDINATALFEQAASIEMSYFSVPAGTLSFEKHVKKFLGLPTNEAAASEALKALEGFFDVVDKMLEEKMFMAGNEFSLVDIWYIPIVQRLFVMGYGDLVLGREAVRAWWERCVDRPAIKEMMDADKVALKGAGR